MECTHTMSLIFTSKVIMSGTHNRNNLTQGETEKIKVKNSYFEIQIFLTKEHLREMNNN